MKKILLLVSIWLGTFSLKAPGSVRSLVESPDGACSSCSQSPVLFVAASGVSPQKASLDDEIHLLLSDLLGEEICRLLELAEALDLAHCKEFTPKTKADTIAFLEIFIVNYQGLIASDELRPGIKDELVRRLGSLMSYQKALARIEDGKFCSSAKNIMNEVFKGTFLEI